MFDIGESRAISHANGTEQQVQQVAPNSRRGRFPTETPLKRDGRLGIQRRQRRKGREEETVEQREHRSAQRRKRRQQNTEEWETGILEAL